MMVCDNCAHMNYAYSAIDQLSDLERDVRKRQNIAHVWVDVQELRMLVMNGLGQHLNIIDSYIDQLVTNGFAEMHPKGMGIRRTLTPELITCSHGEVSCE